MFARIEVAMQPEFSDPQAQGLLKQLALANPALRKKVRWARLIDVYWLDLPISREEMIPAIGEVFWDRVLQWVFSGNLIPSAAGTHGGISDLMESAPNRPGKFWGLERRFRPGVTDNVGRTALEALQLYTGKSLDGARTASGALLLVEGIDLTEDDLGELSRGLFCNELIEAWTLYSEQELVESDRFHQERVKRDFPKLLMRASDRVETYSLDGLNDVEMVDLSQRKLWALSGDEMKAIRSYFANPQVRSNRQKLAITETGDPTDVELEILAQTWSEHCKHKIFAAEVDYTENLPHGEIPVTVMGRSIPNKVDSLFKTTIVGTTRDLPKSWLLSVFDDNAGIVALDDDDAICIKVETHNSPSALDPYGGALTGIVGVNRDILGTGIGARPIFNTDVFCLAAPDYSKKLPDRLLHPRRILEGVRRGVEHGGNKSGIPTVNGALVFDDRYLGKPLIYCGTGGIIPRNVLGKKSQIKEIIPGDRIVMIGGRIGKDGIHGATFSSLALDESSPTSAVQLGDPITQKRVIDFMLEARDMGLYRTVTDNGAGGLSSSVGELARLSGGARMDVSKAKVKYPGLKPYELVVSESQERMTLAVPPDKLSLFLALANRRGVEASDLGEFTNHGAFEVHANNRMVAFIDLQFLHSGNPKLKLQAVWKGRPALPKKQITEAIQDSAPRLLLEMMGRPNIASKEWLIRQYDHEVQGGSVVKPLHTVGVGTPNAQSGPNDAGVVKPKPKSVVGVAVGCGINPKLSDLDPFLMAQSALDEAVRNILAVGAEYGKEESVLALVDNFCWPDPVNDPAMMAALVRTCFGLRDAALQLGLPFVSGKDSMKNDFKGKLTQADGSQTDVKISVPPTLLMTAVGRVPDIRWTRTADFKSPGDAIYILGGQGLSLHGSEFQVLQREKGIHTLPGESKAPQPNWADAKRLYSWLGGGVGKEQGKLKSVHDVSDGGILVAIAEGLIARGLGAVIQLPNGSDAGFNPWDFCFGEGFHTFVVSVTEADSQLLEAEWMTSKILFRKIGSVTGGERFDVRWNIGNQPYSWGVETKALRAAWKREGYFE